MLHAPTWVECAADAAVVTLVPRRKPLQPDGECKRDTSLQALTDISQRSDWNIMTWMGGPCTQRRVSPAPSSRRASTNCAARSGCHPKSWRQCRSGASGDGPSCPAGAGHYAHISAPEQHQLKIPIMPLRFHCRGLTLCAVVCLALHSLGTCVYVQILTVISVKSQPQQMAHVMHLADIQECSLTTHHYTSAHDHCVNEHCRWCQSPSCLVPIWHHARAPKPKHRPAQCALACVVQQVRIGYQVDAVVEELQASRLEGGHCAACYECGMHTSQDICS